MEVTMVEVTVVLTLFSKAQATSTACNMTAKAKQWLEDMRFKTECYGVGFFFLRDLKIDNGEEELEGKILSPVEEE